MIGYLLGAYMTSITLGLIIAFSLSDSSATNTTQHTIGPAGAIGLGAIALAISFGLQTGRDERLRERRTRRKAAKPDKGPPRWQRDSAKGRRERPSSSGRPHTPGCVLSRRAKSDPQTEVLDDGDRAAVVGFNLVMLRLLEVPLASFLSPRLGHHGRSSGSRAG